jgi:hypothetical protein
MDIDEKEREGQCAREDLPTDGDFKTDLKAIDGRVFLEVCLFAEIRKQRIRRYLLWLSINSMN